MCGIAGFWQFKENNRETLKDIITKMTKTLTYRGPDDAGFYVKENLGIALGHRRLSVLDLSPLGHQPMESFNGRYVVVFNGEIYNYRELRKELTSNFNINFKSNSDTEVILAGFEIWGIEKTLRKTNGMFAFALWDKEEKKLYLVRDRIGIKPLYYGIQNNNLFFASELKAIRANRYFKPEIDKNALFLFFRHNYISAPYSIYKDIKKLKPGHYVVIDRNMKVNILCYWDIKKITEEGIKYPISLTEKEAINELEKILLDSIKKRMIVDVPLGAFLSGGIDSSTIVALMQSQSNIPIKTFTIGFYENSYNEAKFAKKIAKYLGTNHTELYITPKEAMEVIPRLTDIYDEPFSDSSQIPTFLISELARKHVTVSLSGDGGDELFLGYNRYFRINKLYSILSHLPFSFRTFVGKTINAVPIEFYQGIANIFVGVLPERMKIERFGDRIYRIADLFNFSSPLEIYCHFVSHLKNPEEIVIGTNHNICGFVKEYENLKLDNFLEKISFIDLLTYLPDDILTKVEGHL